MARLLVFLAIIAAIYLLPIVFQSLAGVAVGIFVLMKTLCQGLLAVLSGLLALLKKVFEQVPLTLREICIRLSVDRRKKLSERNLDIIGAYWSSLREHDNVDEKAEACFEEIAKREGHSRLLTSYREKIPSTFRPDVPAKWIGLQDYIRENLKNRITELRQKREEKERLEEAQDQERKLRETMEREQKRREVEEREAREGRIAAEREASERRKVEREKRERQLAIERQEREQREAIAEMERLRFEGIIKERTELWASSEDLIQKFLYIAERKVSIFDDYGEENWDALLRRSTTASLRSPSAKA